MYGDFYRMEQDPFSREGTSSWFFESETHTSVYRQVLEWIASRDSLLVVHGQEGSGKTLLCGKVLEWFGAHLEFPCVSFSVDKTESEKLHVYSGGREGQQLPSYYRSGLHNDGAGIRAALEAHLGTGMPDAAGNANGQSDPSSRIDRSGSVVVIVDDAGMLSDYAMWELATAMAPTAAGAAACKLLLFSVPIPSERRMWGVLTETFGRSFESQVIRPLSWEEVPEYIYFRMFHAGARGIPVFDDGALETISLFSRGIPGAINTACGRCLRLGEQVRASTIDKEMAKRAIAGLEPPPLAEERRPFPSPATRPKESPPTSPRSSRPSSNVEASGAASSATGIDVLRQFFGAPIQAGKEDAWLKGLIILRVGEPSHAGSIDGGTAEQVLEDLQIFPILDHWRYPIHPAAKEGLGTRPQLTGTSSSGKEEGPASPLDSPLDGIGMGGQAPDAGASSTGQNTWFKGFMITAVLLMIAILLAILFNFKGIMKSLL